MDKNIIGESELVNGIKYFVCSETTSETVNDKNVYDRSLAVLRTKETGKFYKVFTVENFHRKIRDCG